MTQRPFTCLIAGIASALLAVGCSEDVEPRTEPTPVRSGLTTGDKSDTWLEIQDDANPQEWLVAREVALGSSPSEDEARALAGVLQTAAERFRESPRMIANRAVQLETMLKNAGGTETAILLIARLTDAIAGPGRIESFGAAGQQYYNLRQAGMSGEQALGELSRRYGPRS